MTSSHNTTGPYAKVYKDNTVYTDLHAERVISGIDIYVEEWADQVGMYCYEGKLYYVALILVPAFLGQVWHMVAPVLEQDYLCYQDILEANGIRLSPTDH